MRQKTGVLFYLDRNLRDEFKEVCHAQNLSMSYVITQMIEQALLQVKETDKERIYKGRT